MTSETSELIAMLRDHADSLEQQARWIREGADPHVESQFDLGDVDTDELDSAAAVARRSADALASLTADARPAVSFDEDGTLYLQWPNVLLGIDETGVGYSIVRGQKHHAGKFDTAKDWRNACEEIRNALSPPGKQKETERRE